jgi:hypothetical protein
MQLRSCSPAGLSRREGKHFPTMSLIEDSSLVEPEALVEIEVIAALPAYTGTLDRRRGAEHAGSVALTP